MSDIVTSIENWEQVSGRGALKIHICADVLNVKPFKMGQLGKVLKLVGGEVRDSMKENGDIDIVNLLLNSFDKVNILLSMATGKPLEYIEELPMDEGVKLVRAVYEVNKDFFVKSILPQIQTMFPNFSLNLSLETQAAESENGLLQ